TGRRSLQLRRWRDAGEKSLPNLRMDSFFRPGLLAQARWLRVDFARTDHDSLSRNRTVPQRIRPPAVFQVVNAYGFLQLRRAEADGEFQRQHDRAGSQSG